MIKDYKFLIIASLLALAATILAVVKASHSEFAGHQREYYELCDVTNYEIGIQQINVNVGGKTLIDRCTTCHVGFANPGAADFEPPLTAHGPIVPGANEDPHDLAKIGCVVCHDGNGRATSEEDAHGHFHMWPAPLLRGSAVQANCIRCHDTNAEPLAGAPELNLGRRLYIEKVCWSCHTIAGVSTGKIGPDLSDVGARFGMDYLRESIVHPAANIASSRMPQFEWVQDDETVTALTVYLKSQRKTRLKEYAMAPVGTIQPKLMFASIDSASMTAGRKIFFAVQDSDQPRRGGCINCHTVREPDGTLRGGHIGPELTYAGRARDATYLRQQIQNSRGHEPDSIMPAFDELGDKEVDSLVLYLQSLDYVAPNADSGNRIYTTYCASCHGDDLTGRGMNYRLLDPYPRNLSRRQFVESYKERFAESIATGIKGTAMPPWQKILTEEQIGMVVDYITLRSTADDEGGNAGAPFVRLKTALPRIGDIDRMTEQPVREADPARGETAFQAYCTGCHGKLANGKGPNAFTLGNVYPRNLLNDRFMKRDAMDDSRIYRSIILGVPGTPMPSHSHLSDQTLLDMIAYIRNLTK
ncbi:MAG: c-type cytochrome [Lentisphaerae bacterium]|nr:c-type cytochrome [Lentisphaerota bacterium]